MVGRPQVVVGGQQDEAIPLGGQHGPPQLALAVQCPGDALAVGAADQSTGRAGGRRGRRAGACPWSSTACPRVGASLQAAHAWRDPLTASAACGGNADLRSASHPSRLSSRKRAKVRRKVSGSLASGSRAVNASFHCR